MKRTPEMYEHGQDDYPTCPQCQADLEYEDCWKCGGTGGEFLDELLPLEYLPGTWEDCGECGGRGTIDYCPEARRHVSEGVNA